MNKPFLGFAAIALLGTAAAAGTMIVASSGGEEEVAQDVKTAAPAADGVIWGTGPGPRYEEPVLLVPGSYVSPAGSPDAIERGLAADAADKALPRFEGELNGFRVYNYDPATEDGSETKIWCSGGEIVEFR